jgi:UDP-N-acetylmuramoylalanine-D-glutamate ligase
VGAVVSAAAVLPAAWVAGEVAVIGLGKSGRAVAELLARAGARAILPRAAAESIAAEHLERLAAGRATVA